jgi:estrone sulfotransferase
VVDLRRSLMRPAARIVPLPLHRHLRSAQTILRARGLSDADIVVASYPKSGSTWLRFLLIDLASQGADVDFLNVRDLSAPLGAHRHAPKLVEGRGRLVKTHESYASFHKFPARGLCMLRDGRDVAVSHFHFMRRLGVYQGLFDDYLDAFLKGNVNVYGAWHEHVRAWYLGAGRRDDIALLRYEDLLGPDAPGMLRNTLAHIGWEVPAEAVAASIGRNAFENMRKKESRVDVWTARGNRQVDRSVPFVRRGTAGQWHEVFTEAQLRKFKSVAGGSLIMAGYDD